MANSATVGILRALLVADTAEFEQSLGDATKQVQKLETALHDVGGKTVGAMDPAAKSMDLAGAAAERFGKQLDGAGTASAAVATETAAATTELTGFAGIAQAFVEGAGGTLSAETVATAAAFGELALPIAAAAVALGGWLTWVYAYTDVGPMLNALWRDLKDAVAEVADIVGGELVRAWKTFAALTTIFQDAIPGVLGLKLGVLGLNIVLADTITKARVAQGIFELIKAMELGGLSGGIPMPTPASPFRSGGVPGGPGPLVDPKAVEEALNRQIKAAQDAAEAQERYNKAVQAGADILTGKALAKQVKLVADELARAGGVAKITAFEYQELGKKLTTLVTQGAALPPELNAIYVSTLSLTKLVPDMGHGLDVAALGFENVTRSVKEAWKDQVTFNAELDKFNSLAKESPSLITKLVKSWESVKLQPPPSLTTMGQALIDSFAKLGARASDVLFNALATKNWQDVGAQIGQLVGQGIGDAVSQVMVSQGTSQLMSSLYSIPIAGFVAYVVKGLTTAPKSTYKSFAESSRAMLTDLHAQLVGPDGPFKSFEELEAQAQQLGMTFQDVWNPDFKTTFGHHLQERIDEFNAKLKETIAIQDQIAGKFDSLAAQLEGFGGVVPASLRPMIEELLAIGGPGMTDELRTQLQGLAEDPSWQTLQTHAQNLGIDLAALGPSFQQARLSDIAFGYLHDLEMFKDSGADMTGVLKGMSDELSKTYQTAKETGAKLPDTLKPYYQQLVDTGQLVDENGEKIDHLDENAFAKIDDTALKDVVDVLKEIKELLEKALPKAATDAAAGVKDAFTGMDLKIPYSFVEGDARPTLDQPRIGLSGGTYGKFVDWGDGTDVTLHGMERVMTPDELGGGAVNITVISTLDGKEVARNQVRYLPRALQLAGL